MFKQVLQRIPKHLASSNMRAFSAAANASEPVISIPSQEILQKATVYPPILKPYVSEELQNEDLFKMSEAVDVEQMFDARVHYGHKVGTLNDNMKWALFGQRLGFCVFDLDVTKKYMVKALNFLAHISNRGGMILFVTADRTNQLMVERMAADVGQYSHTRKWQDGTLTNTRQLFGSPVRLPDAIVFLSTLTSVLERHPAVIEAAKMAIPTIGIVDSNSDPNYITYPIPGNDDSTTAIRYYMRMFCDAINRGKNARHGIETAPTKETESPTAQEPVKFDIDDF
uniref:Small ribosomal subunit protein uS2m n=1 Tax=Steinernema glaseri TaxID=37863 RepID=A0A1I7YTD0_9BILA